MRAGALWSARDTSSVNESVVDICQGAAMNNRRIVLTAIVLAAAFSRLVPHPPNVTPIAAMALFGGAYLANRKFAYLLPLAATLLSDVVLGYTTYGASLLKSQ